MADTEKVLTQIANLDEKIKQKKAEVKELENKKMELQSKWLDGLMARNNLNFNDVAELIAEKSSHNETTSEKEEPIAESKPVDSSGNGFNGSYQSKHN